MHFYNISQSLITQAYSNLENIFPQVFLKHKSKTQHEV